MPIRKITQYTCDRCGKEVDHFYDRHYVVSAKPYNLKNLAPEDWTHTYVYCSDCIRAMWKAILSANGGEHDVTD